MRYASFFLAWIALFALLPQSAKAVTVSNINGTVTAIVSPGQFVLDTGFPHGHVGVFYSSSITVPRGSQITAGQTVAVAGTFNRLGQLFASSVTLDSNTTSGPGRYHIATWAYDSSSFQGDHASAASVNQLVSYAQGNGKAVSDCHSGSHSCQAVYYLNPNHEWDYSPSSCVNHPDADVLAAASESWFIHNVGHSDSAHRVYGRSGSGCLVWLMNPNSAGNQTWWRNHLRSVADNYDLFFLDSDPMDLVDATFFPSSGGGCNPWPSLCQSTQEIPNNLAEVLARAHFVNAMSHRNGSPMRFFFQQASFNTGLDMSAFAASNRLVGITCEGCIATWAIPVRPNLYARVLNEMAAADASPGAYLLLSHGSFPAGSGLQILQRLVTTGIVWLAYKEGHTIVQPDLEANTNNLAVWPEDLIYPSSPLESMSASSYDLQVAPGVYRREFAHCFQRGAAIGVCATVVNSTGHVETIRSSWLHQPYGHVVTLGGGDVLSGGVANISGGRFNPNLTAVVPGGAVLLTR